jgi:hypothetical protein
MSGTNAGLDRSLWHCFRSGMVLDEKEMDGLAGSTFETGGVTHEFEAR